MRGPFKSLPQDEYEAVELPSEERLEKAVKKANDFLRMSARLRAKGRRMRVADRLAAARTSWLVSDED